MTEQMAVEKLRFLPTPMFDNEADEAKRMAIKALEKQIPQSVKLYIGQDMRCPECNKRLRAYEGMKKCYCKFCGQALER